MATTVHVNEFRYRTSRRDIEGRRAEAADSALSLEEFVRVEAETHVLDQNRIAVPAEADCTIKHRGEMIEVTLLWK